MLPVGAQDLLHAPDEHAGVPVMPARGDHPLSLIAFGLLDEAFHRAHFHRALYVELVARLDVAEPGVGSGRRDTERDQVAPLRGGGRRDQDLPELGALLDDVVRGQHRHDGLRVEGGERGHREADGGRVAAGIGLDDEMIAPELGKLLMDEGPVLGRRDDEDALVRDGLRDSIDRVLEERPVTKEVEELLGTLASRERPESRSGAAGEDEYVKSRHGASARNNRDAWPDGPREASRRLPFARARSRPRGSRRRLSAVPRSPSGAP